MIRVGELKPGKGIGRFQFGLARAEVRALLRDYKLTTYQTEPETDFIAEEGLILGYDQDDRLEFVEVGKPSEVTFNGEEIIQSGLSRALEFLKSIGGLPRRDGSSYYFDRLNVVVFAPEGSLGTIATYKEGYYDR